MTAKNTVFIDLDEVAQEVEYVLKLDGQDHKLVLTTVADFVENTKLIEKLATDARTEDEMDVIVTILNRAFPSIGKDRLNKLTLPQLLKMREFARNAGGENAKKMTDGAEEGSEGNVAANS